MSAAILAIDGVLRRLTGGIPIPEGARLYHALAASGRVVLFDDDFDHDRTSAWLELHGFARHDFVDWSNGTTHSIRANQLRRNGYHIDMVVEPDPAQAALLIRAGLNTLLFVHAQYAHPSWRPDDQAGVQAWAEITELTTRQAHLKAVDERLANES